MYACSAACRELTATVLLGPSLGIGLACRFWGLHNSMLLYPSLYPWQRIHVGSLFPAGIVKSAPFLEMSEADFDAVISVNLKVSTDTP